MAEKVKTAYLTAQKEEVDVSKIVPINRQSWRDKLRAYTKKPFSMAASFSSSRPAPAMTMSSIALPSVNSARPAPAGTGR